MKENLYEKLINKKNSGKELVWDDITRKELEELFKDNSDSIIAELYGISKSKVTYKRKKWNIKIINYAINDFFTSDSNIELFKKINENSKNRLLDKNNFDTISVALTHYLFRNGPVENMHSDGKLSQNDMKTLNKFMVNRISGLLETMHKNEWLKLELLLNFYKIYGRSWDKPIPDTNEIDHVYLNK